MQSQRVLKKMRLAWGAIRPFHWLKNLLIFLPLLAAHRVFDLSLSVRAAMGFWAFSFAASSVYLMNDITDRATDRLHPEKKKRPIASGVLSPEGAAVGALFLLGLSAWIAQPLSGGFHAILIAYLILAGVYSVFLKKLILVDVLVLASFYVLRILAGGRATGVPVSKWFLVFSFFFFISLALSKRVTEVKDLRRHAASQGRGYEDGDFLVLVMFGVCSAFLSVLVLALYVSSADILLLYQNHTRLWLLLPLLLYWNGRLWILAHRGEIDTDPVLFVAKDPISYLVLVSFMGIVTWAI